MFAEPLRPRDEIRNSSHRKAANEEGVKYVAFVCFVHDTHAFESLIENFVSCSRAFSQLSLLSHSLCVCVSFFHLRRDVRGGGGTFDVVDGWQHLLYLCTFS